jgi:hypothetical protein
MVQAYHARLRWFGTWLGCMVDCVVRAWLPSTPICAMSAPFPLLLGHGILIINNFLTSEPNGIGIKHSVIQTYYWREKLSAYTNSYFEIISSIYQCATLLESSRYSIIPTSWSTLQTHIYLLLLMILRFCKPISPSNFQCLSRARLLVNARPAYPP